MFTILGSDGKEYGPVTAGQISEWIIGGRANLQTKARLANDTEWKTLGDFPEFGRRPSTPDEPPLTSTPPPASLSVKIPLQGTPAEIAAGLAGNATHFDLFSCMARSFELWKSNFLPIVGVTLLVMAMQMAIGFVPVLGAIGGLVFGGVFTGGLYYYYLGKIRGEPREVSDAFAGFSKCLVPLILTNLLMNGLLMMVMLPFFGPMFLTIIKLMLQGSSTPVDFPVLSGMAIISICIGVIPLMYLSVGWMFAMALVIDQGLSPWTAMEVSRRVVTRRWFSLFFLIICGTILAMLGLILMFVGLVVTMPLLIGSILYAYEDLCRPPQS